jgi:hypothetical protein
MLLEPYKKFPCKHLHFDFAKEPWEINGYWDLRKKIFCEEQKIFAGTDADKNDVHAIPVIGSCACMGMNDQVIGVVRIDERRPGIWYGSRLGVAMDYRTLSRFKAYHLFHDNRVVHPFTLSVGASLIYKAVSTANAIGCNQFLANVQHQNVSFFQRLHWKSKEEIILHGHLHHVMEADLSFYKPSAYVHGISQLSA